MDYLQMSDLEVEVRLGARSLGTHNFSTEMKPVKVPLST